MVDFCGHLVSQGIKLAKIRWNKNTFDVNFNAVL